MELHPNTNVRALADGYNFLKGFEPIKRGHYVPVDPQLAAAIARVYDIATSVPHAYDVIAAYEALAQELNDQYQYAVAFGYVFEPWTQEGQPYSCSAEMHEDVRNNKHLWFFVGGEGIHELLAGESIVPGWSHNDIFRAVHDLFGHAAEGYQFGARGEENAWIHHSMMFSPLAQWALTTETRGQNCWVNFGAYRDLPPQDRPYAEQKAFLLPVQFCDWRAALAREDNK